MNILNSIISKKVIIPALLLAGSVTTINHLNQNTVSNKQNIEYMSNNPTTLTIEASLLSLFRRRRKNSDITTTEPQTQTNNNIKDWNNIRNTFMTLAEDLFYEKEETDAKIDKLIEKLDKESVDKKLGEFAKQGLKYIKANSENIAYVDSACMGHFEGEAKNLYWSVFHSTKAALYPDIVDEKQKNDLTQWIELGKDFMNNH